jgi:hypothetical protein
MTKPRRTVEKSTIQEYLEGAITTYEQLTHTKFDPDNGSAQIPSEFNNIPQVLMTYGRIAAFLDLLQNE